MFKRLSNEIHKTFLIRLGLVMGRSIILILPWIVTSRYPDHDRSMRTLVYGVTVYIASSIMKRFSWTTIIYGAVIAVLCYSLLSYTFDIFVIAAVAFITGFFVIEIRSSVRRWLLRCLINFAGRIAGAIYAVIIAIAALGLSCPKYLPGGDRITDSFATFVITTYAIIFGLIILDTVVTHRSQIICKIRKGL